MHKALPCCNVRYGTSEPGYHVVPYIVPDAAMHVTLHVITCRAVHDLTPFITIAKDR
jgi:hypothetical protein